MGNLRAKCLKGKNEITKSDIDEYLDEIGNPTVGKGRIGGTEGSQTTPGQARPIVKAYNEYCGEIREIRADAEASLQSEYSDTISTIASCATKLEDYGQKLRLVRDQFMELNAKYMNVGSLGARAGTLEGAHSPAFSVFENWLDGIPASVNPAEKGYFFQSYMTEARTDDGEIADIMTTINILLFNLDSHISATGIITDRSIRAVAGGDDGGVVSSADIEDIVETASSLKLRYLAGFDGGAPANKDLVKYTTWTTPGTFVSAMASMKPISPWAFHWTWDLDQPVDFRVDGTSQPMSSFNITSGGATSTVHVGGWTSDASTAVGSVLSTEAQKEVEKAAIAEVDVKALSATKIEEAVREAQASVAQDRQAAIDFVATYAKNYAFYDPTNSGDSDTVGFSATETYDLLEEKVNDLEKVYRGASKDPIYLKRILEYIRNVKAVAEIIGDQIQCIINAYVDFQEKNNEFLEKIDDAADDLRKALNLKIKGGRGKRYYYPREIRKPDWYESIDDLLEEEFSGNLENYEEEAYRRNPEKLFYKEQCFLLTYIARIAKHKKSEIDGYNFEITSAEFTAGIGDGALIAAAFSGELEQLDEADYTAGFGKRLPYNTSLLREDTFKWDGNASLLLDGDPYGFLNKVAISKNLGPLHNIPSDILSHLQPYIRLFKVEFDPETGEEKDIEISFEPAFTSFEKDLYTNRRVRAAGTGLKSFKFTYDGSNPFGAKKSIKATLSLFSNSFDELMMERNSPTGDREKYRYVDLALKTFNKGEPKFKDIIRENEELMKLNFRLKAQVGYSIPNNFSSLTRIDKKKLQAALRDSVVTLNLIPTIHDFSFDELARVNFTINYLAYVEDTFSQAKFNVFSEPNFAVRRIERNLKMEYFSKKCESSAVNDIKKSYSTVAREEVAESISHLMTTMIERDKIYYMPISTEQIKKFVSFGPFAEDAIFRNRDRPKILSNEDYITQLQKSIDNGLAVYKQEQDAFGSFTDDEEKIISASLAGMDPTKNILSFFYVSELIDIILENIETELREVPDKLSEAKRQNSNQQMYGSDEIDEKIKEYEKYLKAFKKTRFLLGPVEFSNANDPSASQFVNLGDIPISVKYFFEWITSTMLNKDQSFYSLTKFMNDFFNDLVNKFLNNDRCFEYSVKQRSRLYQATLLGAGNKNNDLITSTYVENREVRMNIEEGKVKEMLPLIRTFGHVSDSAVNVINSRDEYNYMVYFVGRTLPTEKMKGIRSEDEAMSIFHYQIGRPAGLVKDIKLTKTQTPGLQEVRFEQEGYDGLEQLRVVYDANISTYANVNTFPGTYIYIDPSGYAPVSHPQKIDLTKYGVGGYYMIVKSEHTFAPGKADSEITAKWVNKLFDPSDKVNDIVVREESGTSAGQVKKQSCSKHVDRAAAASGRDK